MLSKFVYTNIYFMSILKLICKLPIHYIIYHQKSMFFRTLQGTIQSVPLVQTVFLISVEETPRNKNVEKRVGMMKTVLLSLGYGIAGALVVPLNWGTIIKMQLRLRKQVNVSLRSLKYSKYTKKGMHITLV